MTAMLTTDIISAGVLAVKNFAQFVGANKAKLFAFAKQKTEYDAAGRAVITCGDSWRDEDVWDEYYEELTANEGNFSAGSVVCGISVS